MEKLKLKPTNIKIRFDKLVKTYDYENETFSFEVSSALSRDEQTVLGMHRIAIALFDEARKNVMAQIKKAKSEEGW